MDANERAALRAAAEKGAAAEKATPIGHMYNASYMAKVNPAAVLALLAENERMQTALAYIGNVCLAADEGQEPALGYIADQVRAALEPRA